MYAFLKFSVASSSHRNDDRFSVFSSSIPQGQNHLRSPSVILLLVNSQDKRFQSFLSSVSLFGEKSFDNISIGTGLCNVTFSEV
jgi:hypothetical protein